MEGLSSSDDVDRQPQASGVKKTCADESKINIIIHEMVQKLSETLAKVNGNRSSSSTTNSLMDDDDLVVEDDSFIVIPNLDLQNIPNDGSVLDSRVEKFNKLLSGPTTDIDLLRKLSWNGIPRTIRAKTWRILSGYLPPSSERRRSTLERKQEEYYNFVEQYYPKRLDCLHEETFRQIHVDIPRTNPLLPIFQQKVLQQLFERVLFIWAIRHPASGYVQGINDLLVPFFVVFLSDYIENDDPENDKHREFYNPTGSEEDVKPYPNFRKHHCFSKHKDVGSYNVDDIPKRLLDKVEADCFWCLSKLLDGIQNNYTFAQPGIQIKVNKLKTLISRINEPLNQHLLKHNINYLHFALRWMNNLLMRELRLDVGIRLWDTYWSEVDGFATFHVYVCAALLTRFSDAILQQPDFQSLMLFLQNLPCKDWCNDDVSRLVSEAYQLQFMYADAPMHLKRK